VRLRKSEVIRNSVRWGYVSVRSDRRAWGEAVWGWSQTQECEVRWGDGEFSTSSVRWGCMRVRSDWRVWGEVKSEWTAWGEVVWGWGQTGECEVRLSENYHLCCELHFMMYCNNANPMRYSIWVYIFKYFVNKTLVFIPTFGNVSFVHWWVCLPANKISQNQKQLTNSNFRVRFVIIWGFGNNVLVIIVITQMTLCWYDLFHLGIFQQWLKHFFF